MKKTTPFVIAGAAIAGIGAVAGCAACLSASRRKTIASIKKLFDYADGYNLYSMNICYNYDLDAVIARGVGDDQSMVDSFVKEALPLIPVHIEPPQFACTAFTMAEKGSDVRMGRNYDFALDSSAMLVHCAPKDGYKSVATAALDNVGVLDPMKSMRDKLACLVSPFLCLDGVNEKGVSIAVLTLDSKPVKQNTGKVTICTSMAIRLVLDRAATTQEAVDLLSSYDMFASCGRDYHFYITDAKGDGRVVEYDCDSPTRELVATKSSATTNFYVMYKEKVRSYQKNEHYGHGRERYDAVLSVLEQESGNYGDDAAWKALRAAAQDPKPNDITSNTQWSIVYNNTQRNAQIAIRRNWQDVFYYGLEE